MLAMFPVVATMASKYKDLFKYADLTLAQLTPEVLTDIARAVGYDVTIDPAMASVVVDVLRKDDVNKLADLMSNTGALNHVMKAFQDQVIKHEVTSFDLALIGPEDY